jgi:integrase/recombinase XerD
MSKQKAEHFFGKDTIGRFTEWLSVRRRSSSNRDQYSPHLLYWIKFLEAEGTGFKEAAPETFNRYQAWLLNYTSRFNRPLGINTQLNILSAVKVFYRFLHESGHLHHNPAANLRLPKERKTLPTAILTAAEARRLLKQPDLDTVSGFRDRTMLEVLYSCGLRISELRQLKEEDFDSFNRTLTVREGKGDKDRVVPLGETACRYLGEYLAQVRPLLLKEEREILFLNRFGNTYGVSGLCKKLKGYVKAAKIEKTITVHSFRHTLATSMLQRGAELRHIQAILGHDYLHTTERYTKIVKTELRRIQAKHHPREALDLPDGAIKYRGLEK